MNPEFYLATMSESSAELGADFSGGVRGPVGDADPPGPSRRLVEVESSSHRSRATV